MKKLKQGDFIKQVETPIKPKATEHKAFSWNKAVVKPEKPESLNTMLRATRVSKSPPGKSNICIEQLKHQGKTPKQK